MYYIIYLTKNKINGMIYIGRHKTNNIDDGYLGSGSHIRNAISKYGEENFEREIIMMCFSYEDMCEMEAYFVDDDFVLREDTYNQKPGGDDGGGWETLHSESGREMMRKHWQDEYGVDHMFSSRIVIEDRKKLVYDKYGVDNVFKLESVKEKSRKTRLDRYGAEYYSQTEEYNEKIKNTCNERYGVDHPSQHEEFKLKYKETMLDRYGVDNPNKLEKNKKKISNRMKGNQHTKNHKRIFNPATKENKTVSPKDLDWYISCGWEVGNGYSKGSMWVNNGHESKMISKEHLEEYLDKGWNKGRGNTFKKRKTRSDNDHSETINELPL